MVEAYQIKLHGQWGHFRRPEANNNPITYDFIPKTAFVGMLSAIVGIPRNELRAHYKEFCASLYYNVEILNPIQKIATNFRIYKYKGSFSNVENPPQFYEILQNPSFRVTFFGDNQLVKKAIDKLKSGKACFTPTFGLANCSINVTDYREIEIRKYEESNVRTRGFVPFECKVKINPGTTVSYDSIPIVQNDDWFNIKYQKVFYGHLNKDEFLNVSVQNYEHIYSEGNSVMFFV